MEQMTKQQYQVILQQGRDNNMKLAERMAKLEGEFMSIKRILWILVATQLAELGVTII